MGNELLELLWPRSALRIMEEKDERRATRASLPHSPFLDCHAILAVFWERPASNTDSRRHAIPAAQTEFCCLFLCILLQLYL